MNNKVKSEKFRKLSIAALVTGILGYSIILIFQVMEMVSGNWFWLPSMDISRITIGVIFVIGLPAAAIVCGSIDLKRIKAGLYSKKGRGLDITGIVLGSILILVALIDFIASISGGQF
jgi:hypothetical protein